MKCVWGILLTVWMAAAMAIEEPAYEVLGQHGEFELRAYSPKIIAQVEVSGAMGRASGVGFRSIADYIFGNNTARQGGSQKISMTAPVNMEANSTVTNLTSADSMEHPQAQWRMSFVMPSEYDLESLPVPNNQSVKLQQVAAANYAVIRFSGFTGEQKVAAKTAKLLEWMAAKGLMPQGEPTLARYNHPATLPFLRRNEILVRF